MKRCVFFGLLVLLFGPVAWSFDEVELESAWEWIREDPEEWKLEDGVLRLRTQPGAVWGGKGKPLAQNVLVSREAIGAGGTMEALVGLEDPVSIWEQAGLLVYGDDDRFVKLIAEYIEGKMYVVMAWEMLPKRKVVAKIETGEKRLWLRYEVEGETVRGLWRKEGESEWQEAASCAFPRDAKGRFAIFTQSGPEESVRWATVRKIRRE